MNRVYINRDIVNYLQCLNRPVTVYWSNSNPNIGVQRDTGNIVKITYNKFEIDSHYNTMHEFMHHGKNTWFEDSALQTNLIKLVTK